MSDRNWIPSRWTTYRHKASGVLARVTMIEESPPTWLCGAEFNHIREVTLAALDQRAAGETEGSPFPVRYALIDTSTGRYHSDEIAVRYVQPFKLDAGEFLDEWAPLDTKEGT